MRYQIRCVCGHLSEFEIIPMPIEPSHKDKSILDTLLKYHPSCLAVDKKVESLLRVARAVAAEPIVIAGQLGQFKTIVYTDDLAEALKEVEDIL